jgi:hypothetical protein
MPILPHLIEFETDGEAADQPSIEVRRLPSVWLPMLRRIDPEVPHLPAIVEHNRVSVDHLSHGSIEARRVCGREQRCREEKQEDRLLETSAVWGRPV